MVGHGAGRALAQFRARFNSLGRWRRHARQRLIAERTLGASTFDGSAVKRQAAGRAFALIGTGVDGFLGWPGWTSVVVGGKRLPGWKSRHRRQRHAGKES